MQYLPAPISRSGEGVLVNLLFLGEDVRPVLLKVLELLESFGDIDFFTARSLNIS